MLRQATGVLPSVAGDSSPFSLLVMGLKSRRRILGLPKY